MRKPIYGHLTHNLQKEKWYIKSFSYSIVENNLYTKFVKKKEKILVTFLNLLFLPMHVHSYIIIFLRI